MSRVEKESGARRRESRKVRDDWKERREEIK